MTIINCSNLSLIREKKVLLNSINWNVNNQEHWAILGLNGAGKTLLLQIITGYLWPTSGSITVLGQKFGKSSIPQLQRKIGWVSTALQQRMHENETAERIVLSGKFASIGLYEAYTPQEAAAAKEILINADGGSLIGKEYRVLSQGERQLVLICRALMTNPELLILDEPCNGLDLFARERLLKQIQLIAQQPTCPTILYVTHHTEEILPCFQQLLLLKKGQIFAKGLRQTLFNQSVLTDFYEEPIQLVSLENNRIAVFPAVNI
ncbi:ABC transporter ATP-binding protein [Enterococcus sp. LJL128]|uniref:ABC transporter ATP-binding protein n=1 Tax=Enterococcus sp. LJL51 TaxID=3416656 RepID=UPI003CF95471